MEKVKLSYFKQSGKWYADGEYETSIPGENFWEIVEEVRGMVASGKRPGLGDCRPGQNSFHVLMEIGHGPPQMIPLPPVDVPHVRAGTEVWDAKHPG